MEHAGQTGTSPAFDDHRGTGDGGRGGNAAQQGDDDVAHALGHQFTAGIEAFPFHPSCRRAAKQAFDHTQRRNAQRRGDESGQHGHIDAGKQQALGGDEGAGNGADLGHRRGSGIGVEDKIQHHCHHNGRQGTGNKPGQLFGEQRCDEHCQQAEHHRLPVGRKAQLPIRGQLLQGGLPFGHGAEKVVHLSQGDDDGDAGSKAGDHRHRDDGHQTAHLQQSHHQQHHAGQKTRGEHALQAVPGRQSDENGRHGAGGTADLVGRAGQKTDDDTGRNGGDQAAGCIGAAADAEGQRQGQSHRRHRQARHQVGRQGARVVPRKFPGKIRTILLEHNSSSFHMAIPQRPYLFISAYFRK